MHGVLGTFREKVSSRSDCISLLNKCQQLQGEFDRLMGIFDSDFKVYNTNQTIRDEKKKSLDTTRDKLGARLSKITSEVNAKLVQQYSLLDPESLQYKEEEKEYAGMLKKQENDKLADAASLDLYTKKAEQTN